MKKNCWSFALCVGLGLMSMGQQVRSDDSEYKLGPESQVQADVPQGKVTEYTWESNIFEGTKRRYYVYVPAQYDGSEPAALMVFQDGHTYVKRDGTFRAPVVMDNLIHSGDMPVTIGLFLDPGHKGALPSKPGWEPSPANRSFEYDSLGDQYAKFVIDEMIPDLAKTYKLTDNPDMRAIGGISSGGICAFTVAWERPDMFRKVLSHVGSFVDLRGGHNYPPKIRKTPPKPIRVFLQDGSGDLDNQFGNWPLANQEMAAALKFAKYDYEFVYGTGGHNDKHGGAIMPESLKWLWRDWKNQR